MILTKAVLGYSSTAAGYPYRLTVTIYRLPVTQ
jgi:hypothetical protein